MEENRPTASAPSSARGFALKHTMRRVMQVGPHRLLYPFASCIALHADTQTRGNYGPCAGVTRIRGVTPYPAGTLAPMRIATVHCCNCAPLQMQPAGISNDHSS